MIDHVRGVASLFHFSLLAYLEALISVHAKCRCICVALAVTLAVEILNDKHPTPQSQQTSVRLLLLRPRSDKIEDHDEYRQARSGPKVKNGVAYEAQDDAIYYMHELLR